MREKIIAACGNDCAVCPRYVKPPYEKTEVELRRTAELWYKIGYRDRVVTNGEIACTGCEKDNWCRYQVAACVSKREIERCGKCPQYPCERILECFRVTKSFESACRRACEEGEFERMKQAFFEKEENLTVK